MDVNSKYSKIILYYFSGTGNAKSAAHWFNDEAKKRGLECLLINIDRFKEIKIPVLVENTLIGFFSATHGFNVPPIVLKFIYNYPRSKNVDVFLLTTRGGLKLSKLFLPGLSGLAQFLPALILWLKGYNIVGMQPLDLPSNWILLHPGLRHKVIDSIFTRCNRIVKVFANKLLDGKRKYKALLSTPFDLFISPIAIGYYFIGRFFLAKTLISTNECNNCDLCLDNCPVEAIKYKNGRLFWSYNCESCMRCIQTCPKKAIQTSHSFSVTALILGFSIMSPLLTKLIIHYKIINLSSGSKINDNLLGIIIWFIFIIVLFILYRILHYFMRYKTFNKVIAYTSLSKYKFWRRYRAPKKFIGRHDRQDNK